MARFTEWARFAGNICSASLLCGLEMTTKDALLILPCFFWSVFACVCSVIHLVVPLQEGKLPYVVPSLGAWLSVLPSFMSALLIFMYYREAVHQRGIPRETANMLSSLVSFMSVMGFFIYIIFVGAAFAIFRLDGSYKHNGESEFMIGDALWLFLTLLWLILQSCLTPRQRFIEELVNKFESANQPNNEPNATALDKSMLPTPVSTVGRLLNVEVSGIPDAENANASMNHSLEMTSQPRIIGNTSQSAA